MVYETENSKVMAMLREPRLGCSRTNMTLTAGLHSLPSFLTVFLLRAPLSTDVHVLLLNHSINVYVDYPVHVENKKLRHRYAVNNAGSNAQ